MPQARSIAFISPRFAEGPTVGGAETLLRALAEQAAAAGRDVAYLTTCARNHFTWENERPPGIRQQGGLTVHYFPVNEDRDVSAFLRIQESISHGGEISLSDQERWLRNSVNSRALIAHLETQGHQYDRIVAGPYLFGLVYFAALVHPEKTLLVPCLHDEYFAYQNVMRSLFHEVDGCMFNSEPERQLAVRLYDLPQNYGRVVGMGLDLFSADPAAARNRLGFETPYLLYSGRREPLKGTPLLLDYLLAFRQRTGRDIKLVLTGSGEIHPRAELAPHIVDLGFVPEQEKRDVMAAALAFCHPSVNESFGIVLLEAWLAGTPGLVHAGSEVLRDHCQRSGGGLWFRRYPEFEEELAALMDHPDLQTALGQAGKRYVTENYAWDAVERRLLAALDGGNDGR